MPDDTQEPSRAAAPGAFFDLFNEIGIIQQLSRSFFEARLPTGMLLPHFSVLNHLTRVSDGRTPVQIARAFQVPKNTMTHTLAGLEAHGLIELRPNPKDKRSKTVWLTDAGRAFRDEAQAKVTHDLMPILPPVEAAALARVLGLLREVRETLDRARD
ncbi:MAG: MarR family transcriptional regulator [Pseudomonadota bacterium]